MQRNDAARDAVFPATAGTPGGAVHMKRNIDIMRQNLGMTAPDVERIEAISNARAEDSLVTLCGTKDVAKLSDIEGWTP